MRPGDDYYPEEQPEPEPIYSKMEPDWFINCGTPDLLLTYLDLHRAVLGITARISSVHSNLHHIISHRPESLYRPGGGYNLPQPVHVDCCAVESVQKNVRDGDLQAVSLST